MYNGVMIAISTLTILILADAQRYPRVVHPRVISSAELRARGRRSTDENLQFVALDDWILKTRPNEEIRIADGFKAELYDGERSYGSSGYDGAVADDCESREGEVYGKEGQSRVILTSCGDEFFGLVNLSNKTYLVEPLVDTKSGEHLLYEAEYARTRRDSSSKSSIVYETNKRYYNLSGDTFDAENYGENPEVLKELRGELDSRNNELEGLDVARAQEQEQEEDDGVGYFFDSNWHKLPTRKTVGKYLTPKWLELAIIADYSVIDFHGSRVQQYILALLNIVSSIYKDPSLESNMQLVVVRMILYTDKKDGMVQQGNARRSLENVNKWNRKLLAKSNETHDVAVWLTRLDIGGPSGYAPVSGVCDSSRSCALNRDEGLTSAFIIAHEVAHILGLSHDGDKNAGNSCAREAVRGSIMAPMVAATFHNFHWSTCSRKEFHRRAKHWSCLLNRPIAHEPPTVRGGDVSPSEAFGMDEQCRMEFGEGYSRCRSMDSTSLCTHLWCGRTNSSQACKTKKGPPLEGTVCEENKWCINGACEPIDEHRRYEPTPLAVRGGSSRRVALENTWSTWTSWSDCSRTCGTAVQVRTRQCTGSCDGDSREYRICENLPPCSQNRHDPRAEQCSRFYEEHIALRHSPYDLNNTWLPHEAFDATPNCQLVCYGRETGEIFHTGLDVEDGTPCSYESSDICVEGSCQAMGCDNKLGSTSSIRDACGVCTGDNSTCEHVADKFQRKLRRETTRLAIIPRSAANVKLVVAILLTAPADQQPRIVLRDGQRRRRYEMSDFDADGRAPVVIIDGAAFRAERVAAGKYAMWSRGPVVAEIVVSLASPPDLVASSSASISVSTQYSMPRSELRLAKNRYTWLIGAAVGPCSTSCGGGIRRRAPVCRDELSGELVSRRRCLLSPKPPRHREFERCNVISCAQGYTWIPGMWERCSQLVVSSPSSTPCSSKPAGYQQRRLYCVRASFGERQVTRENELRVYRNTVSPVKCQGLKQPATRRECGVSGNVGARVTGVCNGYWLYGDWSACSQSCGRGIQTRKARCIEPDSSTDRQALNLQHHQQLLLDACNATRAPDEIRVCKGTASRNSLECNLKQVKNSSSVSSKCRKDKGQFCAARDLQSYCRNSAFRRRCCVSCRGK